MSSWSRRSGILPKRRARRTAPRHLYPVHDLHDLVLGHGSFSKLTGIDHDAPFFGTRHPPSPASATGPSCRGQPADHPRPWLNRRPAPTSEPSGSGGRPALVMTGDQIRVVLRGQAGQLGSRERGRGSWRESDHLPWACDVSGVIFPIAEFVWRRLGTPGRAGGGDAAAAARPRPAGRH